MVNVFVGDKVKTIGFKVSEDSKKAIEEQARKKGFNKTTDYILTLIDKDMRENEENKNS